MAHGDRSQSGCYATSRVVRGPAEDMTTPSEARPPRACGTPEPDHHGQHDARSFATEHDDKVELGVPSLVWGPGQARRISLIAGRIPLAQRRILDIGCGVGEYVRHLREIPASVIGIDVDVKRVRAGARSDDGVPDLLVGAAEALPFSTGAFDVVLLNEVIEHVQDDHATLEEALRVLSPGGHVVIYAPNRLFPFETHGVYWRGVYRFGNYPLVNYLPSALRERLVPHARAYSRGDIALLLRGLDARVLVHTAVYPSFDRIRSRNNSLGRLLQVIFHQAESTPLRWLGLSHLVILEKPSDADGAAV